MQLAVDTHSVQCKVSPLHYISASTNTAEDCTSIPPTFVVRAPIQFPEGAGCKLAFPILMRLDTKKPPPERGKEVVHTSSEMVLTHQEGDHTAKESEGLAGFPDTTIT